MNFKSFIHLPFNRAWPILVFLAGILGGAQASRAEAAECPGFAKLHLLRSDPVQVNPGARCNMELLFVVQPEGFDVYTPPIPNFCIHVRRVGRADAIGPICYKDKEARLPGDIEYMWSDGSKLLWVDVRLTPKRRR